MDGKQNKKDIKILICTTNLGNKEPSKLSIESWIPYDGAIDTSSEYPIPLLPNSFFHEELGSPFSNKKKLDSTSIRSASSTGNYFQMYDNIINRKETFNKKSSDIDKIEESGDNNNNSYNDSEIEYEMHKSIVNQTDSSYNLYDSIKDPKGKSNINSFGKIDGDDSSSNDSENDSEIHRSIVHQTDSYYKMFKGIDISQKKTVNDSIKLKQKEKYDIIVIGMQEATFLQGSSSCLIQDEKIDDDEDNNTTNNDSTDSDSSSSSEDETTKKSKRKKLRGKVKKTTEQILLPFYAMGTDSNHLNKRTLQDPASILGGTKILQKTIERRCPSYKIIIHNQRGEMRMIVLINQNIVDDIEYADCHGSNTGFGNLLGMGTRMANKGGIVVNLGIYRTRLSFVSAHLAAHEGSTYYKNRCSDMKEIFRQAKGCTSETNNNGYNYDASISNHHLFIFGDLNFRIQLPQSKTLSKEERVEKVLNLVDKQDWITLLKYDELNRAIENGDCCANFKTLPCFFPPTFKVQRLDGFHYKMKRTPSYTDRILWKSAHGHASNVAPIKYEPCPSFSNSDHKPIRGAFSIATNSNHYNKKVFKVPMKCHIFISDLSCNKLNAKCFGTVSSTTFEEKEEHSFYLTFLTSPLELLHNDENITKTDKFPTCHKTHKSKGTIHSIVWEDEEEDVHLILTDPNVPAPSTGVKDIECEIEYNDSFLDGSFLYITLIQKDHDVIIGTATIDLQAMNHMKHSNNTPATYHAEKDDFSWENLYNDELKPTMKLHNCPLRKNSVIQGYISCNISMIWYYFLDREGTNDVFDPCLFCDRDFDERREKGKKKKKKWFKKVNKYLRLSSSDEVSKALKESKSGGKKDS